MKISKDLGKFYHYAFPMQAVLVTCTDKKGVTNPITIAWHTPISKKPPLYAISVAPGRYSYNLIKENKEFVINFANYELVKKVHFCGSHSGRNTDKIKQAGLTLENSEKIKTKYIKECYTHFECKLFKTIPLGDHSLFIGEIVNIKSNKDAYENELLSKNMQPCFYIGDCVYTTIKDKRDEI